MKTQGKLYVVSTPIGNLEDITYRAVNILKEVEIIACEDTRNTKKLLSKYDIHTKLISCHNYNEEKRSALILEHIQNGKDIALVSDAGTPVISDPGYRLIKNMKDQHIEIIPIPGASAAITALSISGLPSDRFLFVGFLPDKEGKRKKKLEDLSQEKATLIFYISKWKLAKTFKNMLDVLGNRKACFCRELTKLHEEIVHTDLEDLSDRYSEKAVKGEITLIVGCEDS